MARQKDTEETKKLKAMANNKENPEVKTEDVEHTEIKSETAPETITTTKEAGSHEEFKKDITVEPATEIKTEPLPNNTSLDPDNLSTEIPKNTWNPTEGIPKSADRDYTKIAGGKEIEEVAESFTEPIMNPETPPGGPEINTTGVKVNPELVNVSDGDREKAARTMWDMIEKAYRMLLEQAPKLVEVSQTQIREMLVKDEINLHMPYPVFNEKEEIVEVQFSEAINIYNGLVKGTLVVDEKFLDEIREPVIREFAKRGIGATDGQKIIFFLIMEGVRVGGAIISLWVMKRSMFREAKLKFAEDKKAFAERKAAETTNGPATQNTEQPEQNANVEEAQVIRTEKREPEEETITEAVVISTTPTPVVDNTKK